jgi:hypothetical protein
MVVRQIGTTFGQNCGIGVFAHSIEAALKKGGVSIATSKTLAHDDRADVVLVQHEWAIVRTEELRNFCAQSRIPVVLFPHTGDAAAWRDHVQGFVFMGESVVSNPGEVPALRLEHPGYHSGPLASRTELKKEFGYEWASAVLGSSGFLTEPRHFGKAVAALLPAAIENNWLITLIAAPHFNSPCHLFTDIDALAETERRHFFYLKEFLPHHELNRRLQACDLLWCWTAMRNHSGYASGVAADMYGSGTRLLLADKAQHRHVLGRPNVVPAPEDHGAFFSAVIQEANRRNFARHDPEPIGWDHFGARLIDFLEGVLKR